MAETLMMAFAAAAPETAAAAGISATGAVAAGSTLSLIGSGLSTALTGLSVVSAISGGQQQSAISKINQRQSELAARTERLKGAQQVSQIRQGLRATLASQNALFAGRGIQLSSGSPTDIASSSSNQASQDIAIAQYGANAQADSLDLQGQQYAAEADSAVTGGYMDAFSVLTKNRNSIRRGGKAIASLVE